MSPIVLLTDFGHQDGFVGIMKGVIHAIAPDCPVIDLSHHIPPQDVSAAAFVLWNSYLHFPPETLFVCVVDPGVGSERDILAVRTKSYRFLVPDNGVLDYILSESIVKSMLRVENPKLLPDNISQTFHGRDIFAPVAAHWQKGFPYTQIGPLHRYSIPESPFVDSKAQQQVSGKIIYQDHFGNLISNIRLLPSQEGSVQIAERDIPLVSAYAAVQPGEILAIAGSHGLLEIAVRNGRAVDVIDKDREIFLELP
ncbi:MAG: SAM-dependent chlorinase/fluorinase [Bacteroidota bacterium]